MRTYTAGEYKAARRHGYAGTVQDRDPELIRAWRNTEPKWQGRYWALLYVPGSGTTLAPINVMGDS